MTQEHPIKPPLELVDKWFDDAPQDYDHVEVSEYVATQAARWGADQELEACCEWVSQFNYDDYSYGEGLRAARRGRTTPPSLKEQALVLIKTVETSQDAGSSWDFSVVRRALESLPD